MNEFLSVKELQEELHVSRATAYRMVKHLPVLRIGNSIRIPKRALIEYLHRYNGHVPTTGSSTQGGYHD